VPRPISYKTYEPPTSFFSRSVQARVKKVAKELDNLNVLPLSTPTYVVCFARSSLFKDPDEGITMINYIKPVSNILSISVDRERLFLHKIQNHQGNEFLRKLIRAEIIGTIGDYCRKIKSTKICFDQMI
jgi:hypothetical protein